MSEKQTTKWYKSLWPIERSQLRKIVPLILLKFFVSFNYAILTCMKDTLVVTSSGSGAEVIPILKGWVVLPLAICAALAYSKLSNRFNRSQIFYGGITGFLTIVLLYAFVLCPNADSILPHASADYLLNKFGNSFAPWISVYRNWIHALFFVTAELWASVVIFLFFWGFTNQICVVDEAKKSYTIFIAAGDIATLITGRVVLHYTLKYAGAGYLLTLQTLIGYVVVFGLIIMGLYWWMNRYVLPHKRFYDPEKMQYKTKEKTKLSLMKGIKLIMSSRYLLSIAVCVLGIALAVNIVEVTWKANLKLLYPNPNDYQRFYAQTTFWIGLVALITVVLFGTNFLRKFGWRFSAMISPIAIGVSGILFFVFHMNKAHIGPFTAWFGLTPLAFIVMFGAAQNILSKVVKYSFFDSTKEIVFIPLDYEEKVKGKAAIDVVGSKIGKSSSSWIQALLIQFAGAGSVLAITPYLLPILFGMVIWWIFSVQYLGKEFKKRTEGTEEEESPADPAAQTV